MITPVFTVLDYQKAREFYIDWLGFHLDWVEQLKNGTLYMQVSRGDVVLHLTDNHKSGFPGSRVRANINGLVAYHHILLKKDYPFTRPGLVKANWSEKVMEAEVIDPFGNRIIFQEACA
ncbi:glyoxalase superfamily protein [Hymenobacter terrenus]|uniref:glyoxalase superfamily protein n=1 Tax=Hymenobacter terrenus TaxID=1629124 RepID=UPI000619E69F|nr:glyoxalase superfamily protein [Hymenobacter terrenus]